MNMGFLGSSCPYFPSTLLQTEEVRKRSEDVQLQVFVRWVETQGEREMIETRAQDRSGALEM